MTTVDTNSDYPVLVIKRVHLKYGIYINSGLLLESLILVHVSEQYYGNITNMISVSIRRRYTPLHK